MSKWTPIEKGSASKDSLQDDEQQEDSLNLNDVEDLEDENSEITDDNDISDEEVDDNFSDEDEEVEQTEESAQDETETDDKTPQSRGERRKNQLQEEIRNLANQKRALEEQLRNKTSENQNLAKNARKSAKASVTAEISALQMRIANAEAAMKKAVEVNDPEILVKATKEFTTSQVELMALERNKIQLEEDETAAPNQTSQNQPNKVEPPVYARQWAERNKGWFDVDPALTGAALGVNQKLLQEGLDPQSPEFYSEIDKRMARFLPKKAGNKQPVTNARKTPPTGESSRVTPKSNTQATPRDREVARKMGVDPTTYLRHKAAYEANESKETRSYKPILIVRPNDKK